MARKDDLSVKDLNESVIMVTEVNEEVNKEVYYEVNNAQQVHTPVSSMKSVKVCELYLVFTGTWTVIAR